MRRLWRLAGTGAAGSKTAVATQPPLRASRLRWRSLLCLVFVACEGESFVASRVDVPSGPAPAAIGAPAARAERVHARVARVADGDSLAVTFADGGREDVRLQGIDAPEARQPWGRESADHLRRLALGQEVELQHRGIDAYGRRLAVVIADRGDLGLLQIQGGHAWHYRRYADEQGPGASERYAAAERAARAGRLGLWSATAPVAPWDFKAARRTPAGRTVESAAPSRTARVIGNRRSRLYHLPGCPGHAAVGRNNAVPFDSEAAARAAGYRRASNC